MSPSWLGCSGIATARRPRAKSRLLAASTAAVPVLSWREAGSVPGIGASRDGPPRKFLPHDRGRPKFCVAWPRCLSGAVRRSWGT